VTEFRRCFEPKTFNHSYDDFRIRISRERRGRVGDPLKQLALGLVSVGHVKPLSDASCQSATRRNITPVFCNEAPSGPCASMRSLLSLYAARLGLWACCRLKSSAVFPSTRLPDPTDRAQQRIRQIDTQI
jgi:hypothetical protein